MALYRETIEISLEEYNSGKYQSTSTRGSNRYADVYYNNGKIVPESTYTDRYQKEKGIGKYAPDQKADVKKKVGKEIKVISGHGGKIFCWLL